MPDNNANYILIDFIDERLDLMKYNNCINTLSDELRTSNFLDFFNVDQISKFSLEKSFWKKSMREYLEKLLKIYDEENIIIHETFFVDSYLTNNGNIKSFPEHQIEFNMKINELLKEYYYHYYFKTRLPDPKNNKYNIKL